MNDLLADPVIQSSALPLLLGFALTIGLRLAAGRRAAATAVPLGFILLYLWVIGLPALPPPAALGKLFWAVVAGTALGLGLDLLRIDGARRGAALLLGLVAALGWIIGGALSGPADWIVLILAALTGGAAAFVPAPAGEREPVSAAAATFAMALAVGGVALIGASASLAQLGLGLAAGLGGFLLWNWPVARHPWGAAGRATSGIVILLAAVLAVFSTAPAAALLPALLCPLFARFAARLPLPANGLGRALRPALSVVLALVPALAALGLAWLLTGGEAAPY